MSKLPRFTAKDYTALKGLQAISDEQVTVHLALYNGYVTRSNKLAEQLEAMLGDGKSATAEYQELKRRAGWENNGVILHELYFDNLAPGGKGNGGESRFGQAVAKQYGGFDTWKADMLGVAKMPGVGWAVTYFDPSRKGFDNFWIDRHDVGHPAGYVPVVVLDLWEHAWSVYLKPTERAKYLEDFFANVSWAAVDKRSF